jgi:phosphatidylethanolamine/phosphatidyl-N-methylethanolamine N-methyltransferase
LKGLAENPRRTSSRAAATRLGSAAAARRASIDLASIRRAYRRYARVYDAVFGRVLQPGRVEAVKAANTSPGQRILEIGVGTGLSLATYRSDARVVGIDVCAEMLDQARQRARRLRLEQVEALLEMDAEEIDFPDHSFDAVVALYAMTVVPNLPKVAAEMRRVCTSGGAIIVVNHFASDQPVLRKLESILTPLSTKMGFRSDLGLQQLTDAMGLAPASIRPANLFGYWKLVRFRNGEV